MSKLRDPSKYQLRQRDAKKALAEGTQSERLAIKHLLDGGLVQFGQREGAVLQVPIYRVPKEHKAALTRLTTRISRASTSRASDDGPLPWTEYLAAKLPTYQKNALRRGLSFELSRQDIPSLLQRSQWKCAVTKIGFSMDRYGGAKAPFSPSIDRIDNSKGYTMDNTRIVCLIVNIAMNEWGTCAFLELLNRCAQKN